MAKRGYKLQELIAHASDVKCLNIGKKSCRVFVSGGEDRKVNLWAIGKPNALLSLSGHTSPIESVTFDSSEAMVLAGASTGAIKLWDLADAKVVRTLSGHKSKCSSLEFHPFGEFFASGSSDTDLKIWDIRKKGCIHTYKGHTRGITTIRFTPDGRWLVSGGEDNVVKLWDLTAGKLLHDFKFHNGPVRSIDFHPHEFLLATGSADRTVKFWDLETFELIGSAGPEATGVRSMIFHPDGKTLVCGLDRMLKVFSWEPIRCHDDADIGWSNLGDICINEGKLLGCSYHESSVGVWVVDLSLIRTYAAGGYPRCSAFVEPEISADSHTVNSVPACLNVCDEQKVDTKEIIHTECNTYKTEDDPGQKLYGTVGSNKASKGSQRGSAVSKVHKDISSCVDNQMVDKISILKTSVSNLTSSINSDVREGKLVTTKVNGSVSSRKGTPVNSSGFIGSSLSDPKKESITDSRRRGNVRVNNTICTPVVVMRDTPDLPKSKLHNKTAVSDLEAHNAGLYKPFHTRRPSFVDVGIEIHPVTGYSVSSARTSDVTEDVTDLQYRPGSANAEITNSKAGNYESIKSTTEAFQRVVFLDPSFSSRKETADQEPICDNSKTSPLNNVKENKDSPCSTTELKSVKYVKGVAVQHGRTKSLVESWEKREKITNSCTTTDEPSLDPNPPIADPYIPSRQDEQIRSSERKLISEDDDITSSLMQNRDMLINVLKSRLTKLQMVRHCWEQNGIKGAINSVAKLPDLSVQVDVINVLTEKPNLLTLDSFSCLLPILMRSLSSKTERHIDISLDMMLKLVKLFWPMVHSTMSAFSPVGVDIEAEERMTRCRQIFGQLEKIRDILPSLIRKGGLIARRSLELNLALQS